MTAKTFTKQMVKSTWCFVNVARRHSLCYHIKRTHYRTISWPQQRYRVRALVKLEIAAALFNRQQGVVSAPLFVTRKKSDSFTISFICKAEIEPHAD